MLTPQNELSPGQKVIIKKVCKIQLSCLRRIYNNDLLSDLDLVMILIYNEIDRDEFNDQLQFNIEKFSKVVLNPELVTTVLDSHDLSMFKHILNHLDDGIKNKYPNSFINLWSKLFLKEELQLDITNLN